MNRREADRIVDGYDAERYALELPDRLVRALGRAAIVDESELSRDLTASVDVRRHHARLTERECRIVSLMSYGFENAQIADVLGIELETVKAHAKKIQHVLAAKNRTHAVGLALRLGLID